MNLNLSQKIIHYHFDILDSTNSWAKREAATFAREKFTIVSADQQTAGRGRLGRRWLSDKGENLYCSFCFFVGAVQHDFGILSMMMALSAVELLQGLGLKPRLKWPNDIQLNNKKVAGILTEITPIEDQFCVVIGIGLNVNMLFSASCQIDQAATSLYMETENQFDVSDILNRLQQNFVCKFSDLKEGKLLRKALLDDYKRCLKHEIGSPIRFNDGKKVWEGSFVGIDDLGALGIKLADGKIHFLSSGELDFNS